LFFTHNLGRIYTVMPLNLAWAIVADNQQLENVNETFMDTLLQEAKIFLNLKNWPIDLHDSPRGRKIAAGNAEKGVCSIPSTKIERIQMFLSAIKRHLRQI